jgi:hypothetical protein
MSLANRESILADAELDDGLNHDEPERVTIHSPRLNANLYLMDLLNAGLWLAGKVAIERNRKRVIEIFLHPVGGPWTPWLRVLCDPFKLPGFVRRHLFGAPRSVVRRSDSAKGNRKVGIIKSICSQSSGVWIRVDRKVMINIRLLNSGYLKSLGPTLSALWTAAWYWIRCLRRGKLDVQRFLLLRHRSLHIGDLIASESLRRDPAAGGSLLRCGRLGMFWCLVGGVYTTNYVDAMEWQSHPPAYVAIPEPTYLEAIYCRALRHKGLRILELHDYAKPFRIIPPEEEERIPYVARINKGVRLSHSQQEKVWQYMAERLSDSSKHLSYMFSGQNINSCASVRSINRESIAMERKSLTMVLFMHYFDDAQYCFGLDGFEDLYDWTIVSIDECLMNTHVGRILVKAHPNADPLFHPGDKIGVEMIRRRYHHEPRVIFIEPHTSITGISSLGLVYGLTHHGSVAEELVAVGVPVIASSKAPWGTTYPFLRVWNSSGEYIDILKSLHAANWLPPNDAQKEALAQFVSEYRLNVEPERDHESWFQWMNWADKTTHELSRDSFTEAIRRIGALEQDSPLLLEWLREHASAYRLSGIV